MNKLTESDCKELLGGVMYNQDKPVHLYVPSTKFEQPIIMYHHKEYGDTKHYLENEVKLGFETGLHSFQPSSKDGV